MTTVSPIVSDVDAFVAAQNQGRSGVTPLDYDALTGTVPAGGNSVTGIAGIASGAAAISLPSSAIGNAVIVDGAISTSASTGGVDSYSLAVAPNSTMTLTDNNTGFSQTITGASEILFDGGATTSGGAYQSLYIVATGAAAQIAAMYDAAFQRVPDLQGLDFYLSRYGTAALPDLHTAAGFFLTSPEEQKLYPAVLTAPDHGGTNDQQFVSQLYGGILHRVPTSAEVMFYAGALAGTLTDSSGHVMAAVDRATVLEYFTSSPENQADIAGWLINPANGAVNFGAMSQASAAAVLASDVASGTVNLSDFANMASDGSAGTGTVTVYGPDYTYPGSGLKTGYPEISTTQANLTINLTAQYYAAQMGAAGLTVNGVSGGGSVILTPSWDPQPGIVNDGGTVNLFGGNNQIFLGNTQNGGITVPTQIHGWAASDLLTEAGTSGAAGTVLQGSVGSPISGAALAAEDHNQGFQPSFNLFAVNIGSLADDSTATAVAAIQKVYTVADAKAENAFFFGQDQQGNTMVFWWRGDTGHTGAVQTSDITGAVELVGVQASSLTGANFHA